MAMLLGFTVLMAAWDSGVGVLGAAALAVEALLGTAALAVVGRRGRRLVPWASGSLRGHLLWSTAVFLLGTAGAAAFGYLLMTPYGMAGTTTWQLLLLTGPPYAIAAALLVPRLTLRIGALAAAAVVGLAAALLAYADTAATEAAIAHPTPPPPLPLTRLTLVGDRPPGYDGPSLVLSNRTAFVTRYAEPTGEAIVLRINHAPKDGSRPYDAACDPSLSPSVTCADDGGGRTLVTDRKARTRELYVRHGAVDAVASLDTGASLPAARRLLTTLRPPTARERAA
ncbi:hypothetical protein [Streptomyces sp. NPDC053542]|uniref:hypothetical protein n=1 Tax=Streptomyces sp. NPDC053542 TaxID=3365710 RepID=UPI0037D52447